MARGNDQKVIAQAAERMSGLLIAAVEETLAERTPEPGRARIADLLGTDGRPAAGDEDRATELMVTLILVRWLSVARERLAGQPDRIEPVLSWIDGALGRRYRSRAAYTASVLRDEAGAAEIMGFRKALQNDFLPSLVWLLAGVVATSGDGGVDWLRDLVGAPA